MTGIWLLPSEVMLMVSHDSNMTEERWSAKFRGLLGVSCGVNCFGYGEKKHEPQWLKDLYKSVSVIIKVHCNYQLIFVALYFYIFIYFLAVFFCRGYL